MEIPKRLLPITFFVLFIMSTAGCGESNPTNSFEPSVTNTTDEFIFRANNVYMVTTRLSYNWTNTGTTASVEHASGRSGGTGTLFIFDSEGTPVYQNELKSSSTVPDVTIAGNPGEWSIVLDLKEYSGSIYFRIRKV